MANENLEERLQDFLTNPREEINFEIKEWLDIGSRNSKDSKIARANLAKEILGLANHGGGKILVGYKETENGWNPQVKENPPLDSYEQDTIQNIVERYADPEFQCKVDLVEHPKMDQKFPIIDVPGGHTVPIRAKKDGSHQAHVSKDTYYIRRPGPESAPPQNAKEWDELIKRCVRSSKEELMDNIRNIVIGYEEGEELSEEEEAQFEEWIEQAEERFEERVENEFTKISKSPFQYGYWTLSYKIKNIEDEKSLSNFRETLKGVRGNETGWPPWSEIQPKYVANIDSEIECWIRSERFQDSAHMDFWRASPDGKLFLLRGYQEDRPGRDQGEIFDLTLPIWRIGECLLHAERLAEEIGEQETEIEIKVKWTGLSGRTLRPMMSQRFLPLSYESENDAVENRIIVKSGSIRENLPEIVKEITMPLYQSFDFFEPADSVFKEEIEKMLN